MSARLWLTGQHLARWRTAGRRIAPRPLGRRCIAQRHLGQPRLRGRSAAGQGIVEYGLILSLSTLLAVGLHVFAGGLLADVLQLVADAVAASEGSG